MVPAPLSKAEDRTASRSSRRFLAEDARPSPMGGNNVALLGASTAFTKAPDPPARLVNTYSGSNGAIAAATSVESVRRQRSGEKGLLPGQRRGDGKGGAAKISQGPLAAAQRSMSGDNLRRITDGTAFRGTLRDRAAVGTAPSPSNVAASLAAYRFMQLKLDQAARSHPGARTGTYHAIHMDDTTVDELPQGGTVQVLRIQFSEDDSHAQGRRRDAGTRSAPQTLQGLVETIPTAATASLIKLFEEDKKKAVVQNDPPKPLVVPKDSPPVIFAPKPVRPTSFAPSPPTVSPRDADKGPRLKRLSKSVVTQLAEGVARAAPSLLGKREQESQSSAAKSSSSDGPLQPVKSTRPSVKNLYEPTGSDSSRLVRDVPAASKIQVSSSAAFDPSQECEARHQSPDTLSKASPVKNMRPAATPLVHAELSASQSMPRLLRDLPKERFPLASPSMTRLISSSSTEVHQGHDVDAVDKSSSASSATLPGPTGLDQSRPISRPPLRRGLSYMSENSLANAIVASSLASSRAPSPSVLPEPLRARRTSKSRHIFHAHRTSRTPSPTRTMRQTMRKQPNSDEEDDDDAMSRRRRKTHLLKKHPNKHHEGARKRWRDVVTERERKRYEGVWAANKGVPVSASVTRQPRWYLSIDADSVVLNVVVRDIWSRSRLGNDVLEEVWDLVDRKVLGVLDREEFVVGMWLIDQRLKGRKLPVKVSASVWDSVRAMSGVKIPRNKR